MHFPSPSNGAGALQPFTEVQGYVLFWPLQLNLHAHKHTHPKRFAAKSRSICSAVQEDEQPRLSSASPRISFHPRTNTIAPRKCLFHLRHMKYLFSLIISDYIIIHVCAAIVKGHPSTSRPLQRSGRQSTSRVILNRPSWRDAVREHYVAATRQTLNVTFYACLNMCECVAFCYSPFIGGASVKNSVRGVDDCIFALRSWLHVAKWRSV